MSFKDQMRKDFETVFLNTDEFAETFTVIRNGSISHNIDGVFSSKTILGVKLDADIIAGDILQNQSTQQKISVQKVVSDSICKKIYCR